jgi:3',5'-nucleoside bisphosphate phosphatase
MIKDSEGLIDLHTHTNHSDGELTPSELLDKARRYGLAAISITDHETVSPYSSETARHAEQAGVELVPGIEISTQGAKDNPYHILGLLIDPSNQALNSQLEDMQTQRIWYARTMCDLLEGAMGLEIDRDALFEGGGIITKGNIARAVVGDPGNTSRLKHLFDGDVPTEGRFIEATMIKGKPCYIERPGVISPQHAVDLIHGANGVALLAHPAFYVMKGEPLEELCGRAVSWGIDGLEAINVQHDKSKGDQRVDLTDKFTTFAVKNNLVISGGSDYHTDKPNFGKHIDLGFRNYPGRSVPYTVLDNLRQRQISRFGNKK